MALQASVKDDTSFEPKPVGLRRQVSKDEEVISDSSSTSRASGSHGQKVEIRVRHIAAMLGVPEFVYGQPLVHKGAAVREVGDGILLCGVSGAIIQVKSRSRNEGRIDSPEQANRWILKHIERAVRQGRGSKRTIEAHRRAGNPLAVTPVRAMTISASTRFDSEVLLTEDCTHWPTIVVVDHPKNPQVNVPEYPDAFCISLNDWRRLNEHLRSINFLLRYILTALSGRPAKDVRIGCEAERYSSFIATEAKHLSEEIGTERASAFGILPDMKAVSIYRDLIESTWGPNDESLGLPIGDYTDILDFLDDVPVAVQSYTGYWLIYQREQLLGLRRRVSGLTIIVNRPLIYMVDFFDNCPNKKEWLAMLWGLTAVRSMEWRSYKKEESNTLGVGVRVMNDGSEEYSFILIRPGISLPDSLVRQTQWIFGEMDARLLQARQPRVGRNERCPCGSQKKFKRCHGAIR
ncbi:YecA family protein [Nocardia iowensis]|uniref:SEC-C domain-containing protein n=1 Tax=Nocardia iowensis TaxID=204891 RepID=A0ABX8RZZ9_NOCIO|nr:SEC-C domain-containing protein [Nocardia iowensis]QXN94557.1 SEC-C domain-containing protein [Nocardia iowensis]